MSISSNAAAFCQEINLQLGFTFYRAVQLWSVRWAASLCSCVLPRTPAEPLLLRTPGLGESLWICLCLSTPPLEATSWAPHQDQRDLLWAARGPAASHMSPSPHGLRFPLGALFEKFWALWIPTWLHPLTYSKMRPTNWSTVCFPGHDASLSLQTISKPVCSTPDLVYTAINDKWLVLTFIGVLDNAKWTGLILNTQ